MATQAIDPVHDRLARFAPGRPSRAVHLAGQVAFVIALLSGLAYAGVSVVIDAGQVGEPLALGAFLFLGLALLIALGFEFVNGFHDTANAVATVIYTQSLKTGAGSGLVGLLEPHRRPALQRRGGVLDRHAAADRPGAGDRFRRAATP